MLVSFTLRLPMRGGQHDPSDRNAEAEVPRYIYSMYYVLLYATTHDHSLLSSGNPTPAPSTSTLGCLMATQRTAFAVSAHLQLHAAALQLNPYSQHMHIPSCKNFLSGGGEIKTVSRGPIGGGGRMFQPLGSWNEKRKRERELRNRPPCWRIRPLPDHGASQS